MDFFDPPHADKDYNQILLAIDRRRKHLNLIPCRKDDTAEITAKRYIDHVVRHQGVPQYRRRSRPNLDVSLLESNYGPV